tara:strand:- start:14073 stop:14870 length:798 start_codon:yes stop_codon:yes gene_type:complete
VSTISIFPAGDDPGADFVKLLKRNGQEPFSKDLPGVIDAGHATTVIGIRCNEGVVMAGDRRATSGHLISHRDMQKVFPADRHSAVGIAGAAGPAIQMVRVFQLQLEYYEKIEGKPLSLDGKANQLSEMIRGNLPQAMQGLAVVPIFGGFDLARNAGRLFQFDITGGRYEEQEYAASGSGSLHAGTVIKLGFQKSMPADAALSLAVKALWHAADEDSATGGPDPIRGIYPILAVISAQGFRQLSDEESAAVFTDLQTELNGDGIKS